MTKGPLYISRRTELKTELYALLSMLHDHGPAALTSGTDDPVEEEGLGDDELAELVAAYRMQRDQELQLYRRNYPMLETDLVALAKRNREQRGVLGFNDDELACTNNAGLGFCLYPSGAIHRLCRLLGWTTRQEVLSCPDCSAPHVETLWMPPSPPVPRPPT